MVITPTLIELVAAGLFTTLIGIVLAYRSKLGIAYSRLNSSKELINNLEEGVYRSSLDGKQLSANPALVRLNGYESEEVMLRSVNDIAKEWYVLPERRDEFSQMLKKDGKVTDFVSEIYRHKTRERIWISENARMVYDPKTGLPSHYEGTVRDITDTVERRNSDNLLNMIADNLPSGLFQLVKSPDGKYSMPYASQRFREMGKTGTQKQIDPNHYISLLHPGDVRGYQEQLKISARDCSALKSEFRFRAGADEEYQWMRISASCEQKPDGSYVWHGYLTNITEWKRAQERIEKLAYFDSLTGLSNRPHFVEEVSRQLKLKNMEHQHHAFCFVDLDNFKPLNDTYGHDFGDRLLKASADRLGETVSNPGKIARFGGDEFVIFLGKLGKNESRAEKLAHSHAQKLLDAFRRGFEIEGAKLALTISIGIVMFNGRSGTDIGDLIKCADVAMYDVKKSGRNNISFHDVKSQNSTNKSYQLQRDIPAAARKNQFELEYQPQVGRDGKVRSAEALLRWKHPERGRIMPAEFIPLAEQTGQINRVNEWVVKESVRTLSRWSNRHGMDEIRLSVNISPRQLLDRQFGLQLLGLLEENMVESSRLMIELTEHAMAHEPETVARSMHELKKAGIRFSLDDFGTGYSSLSQLKQFPFDELKIDGTFVSGIAHSKDTESVVLAIINMANALKMQTVAEHVAEESQYARLHSLNCNLFQGYMFARPLSQRDFETFVRAHHSSKRSPYGQNSQGGNTAA